MENSTTYKKTKHKVGFITMGVTKLCDIAQEERLLKYILSKAERKNILSQLPLHGGITESELLKLSVGTVRKDVGVALLANSGM